MLFVRSFYFSNVLFVSEWGCRHMSVCAPLGCSLSPHICNAVENRHTKKQREMNQPPRSQIYIYSFFKTLTQPSTEFNAKIPLARSYLQSPILLDLGVTLHFKRYSALLKHICNAHTALLHGVGLGWRRCKLQRSPLK